MAYLAITSPSDDVFLVFALTVLDVTMYGLTRIYLNYYSYQLV